MDDVKKPYEGYFSVIIPDNLKKLLNGDILKLRDAVTEFSKFLGEYGETASEVEEGFYDDDDITYWIYYHSLSFAFPDNKILVGIKSANEKMFRNIQQGIVDGRFKIYLRGTAKVSKNDIEGVDKNIKKVTIKKIESYWEGKLHSSSPDVSRILETGDEQKVDEVNKHFSEPKPLKISDLPTAVYSTDDDIFVLTEDDINNKFIKSGVIDVDKIFELYIKYREQKFIDDY